MFRNIHNVKFGAVLKAVGEVMGGRPERGVALLLRLDLYHTTSFYLCNDYLVILILNLVS